MNAALDDGGQAFPSTYSESWGGEVSNSRVEGMSLRDWFASQYLATSSDLVKQTLGRVDEQSVAERCYRMADAMLKARGRQP